LLSVFHCRGKHCSNKGLKPVNAKNSRILLLVLAIQYTLFSIGFAHCTETDNNGHTRGAAHPIIVSILNVIGQPIFTQEYLAKKGVAKLILDKSTYPKGMYSIQSESENEKQTFMWVKF